MQFNMANGPRVRLPSSCLTGLRGFSTFPSDCEAIAQAILASCTDICLQQARRRQAQQSELGNVQMQWLALPNVGRPCCREAAALRSAFHAKTRLAWVPQALKKNVKRGGGAGAAQPGKRNSYQATSCGLITYS